MGDYLATRGDTFSLTSALSMRTCHAVGNSQLLFTDRGTVALSH